MRILRKMDPDFVPWLLRIVFHLCLFLRKEYTELDSTEKPVSVIWVREITSSSYGCPKLRPTNINNFYSVQAFQFKWISQFILTPVIGSYIKKIINFCLSFFPLVSLNYFSIFFAGWSDFPNPLHLKTYSNIFSSFWYHRDWAK